MGTYLAFEGVITGCKPVIAKKDQYGMGKAGSLEMTLVVDQPQPAPRPRLAYNYEADEGGLITKEDYEANLERRFPDLTAAKKKQELAAYDAYVADYNQQMAKWEQAQASFTARLRSYASLVGIAAVFGNQKLAVTLTPAQQDMFPGFELDLLPAPEGNASLGSSGLAPEGAGT